MKGITPVIAIILLLMVTIVVIGFATGFFQSMINVAGSQLEEQTQQTTQQIAKVVTIDSAATVGSNTEVTVRASGSKDVPSSEISVFLDDAIQSCTFSPDPVVVGTTSTCTISGQTCSSGTEVKVTSPGGEDTFEC